MSISNASWPVSVTATASDNVGLRGFEIRYQPNQGSEVLWVIGVGASETLRAAPGDQAAKLLAYTGILPDAI